MFKWSFHIDDGLGKYAALFLFMHCSMYARVQVLCAEFGYSSVHLAISWYLTLTWIGVLYRCLFICIFSYHYHRRLFCEWEFVGFWEPFNGWISRTDRIRAPFFHDKYTIIHIHIILLNFHFTSSVCDMSVGKVWPPCNK